MKIDVDEINNKAPYKVRLIYDELNVIFDTDFGVQYVAGFDRDDTSLPFTKTYQFSIVNVNNKKSPRDHKVRETIIAILENFFMQNNEVMLYICETGDGKQSMRNRLFGYWFNHYKESWNLLFMSASIYDIDGVKNYTAIIIRQDHPHLSEITNEFTETVKLLNDKPGSAR